MLRTFKNKLKNLGSKINPPAFYTGHSEFDLLLESIINEVVDASDWIYPSSQLKFTASNSYNELKKFKAETKKDFLLYLQKKVIIGARLAYSSKGGYTNTNRNGNHFNRYAVSQNLFSLLMRSKLSLSEDELLGIIETYIEVDEMENIHMSFVDWPIGFTATQFVKFVEGNQVSDSFVKRIQSILKTDQYNKGRQWSGMDVGAAKDKMLQALQINSGEKITFEAFKADDSDGFGQVVNHFISELEAEEVSKWSQLFQHCAHSSGSKPKKSWIEKSNLLINDISINKFKEKANLFVNTARKLEFLETTSTYSYGGEDQLYTHTTYLEDSNKDLLKGLVWTLERFHDTKTLQAISQLTEKCFQKIPGIGPAAAGLGNACIYVLANSKGMEGISHLSRLKLRIRQNNTQKLINQYIEDQANKQGLLPSQVEELAAPDFNLINGERIEEFDDFKLILNVVGVGKTELKWVKPDGKEQKSVPTFIKNSVKLSDKLKKIRATAKQIKQASTAQRDRIDRLYVENRSWSFEDFSKFYIEHGLVSTIALKLIWLLKVDGKEIPVFFHKKEWRDIEGQSYKLNKKSQIRLWHPIHSTSQEVLRWRDKLDELKIQQPMKQAYREIYLLTDAEVNTKTYSNRMASHFLKQHQFNALASLRGWKYSLLGAYDDGRDGETALKTLKAHEMTAEFWIYEVYDDNDSFNDSGIWDYVATDQVRFVNNNNDAVDLIDVDKLLLSEVMRDVDLFVGVTSVGNDPQWQDNDGSTRYGDYWQSYSFGDLSEVAKTRKQVLERLVPRLKIKDVAEIEGKFLIIKGVRNTYKIHIGSTNILISPNDRYLCIVPSRGKNIKTDNIFLPFEGDRGLSIILSKAFMLAEDDKIKDHSIISQL